MEQLFVKDGERIDDLQLKGLKIIQNPSWFCYGIDAVLLSYFARTRTSERVVDLGTGTGIIPLLMYGKYSPKEITGVEIQENVAEMAERSIKLNNLQGRIKIYRGDIKNCPDALGKVVYDVVVSNPPYKRDKTGIINTHDTKAVSRHEILINLDELIYSASMLLKHGGRFYMIHRPERLKDIILGLENNNMTLKRLRFVQSFSNKAPTMVLVEAAKFGGEFLKVEAPLYVYNEDGSYTQEIKEIYGIEGCD